MFLCLIIICYCLLGGGLELWVDYSCYCRHQTLCLHAFGALGVTSIHSYFISQTTKGCYCQQIGEGGISPWSNAVHATEITLSQPRLNQPIIFAVIYVTCIVGLSANVLSLQVLNFMLGSNLYIHRYLTLHIQRIWNYSNHAHLLLLHMI